MNLSEMTSQIVWRSVTWGEVRQVTTEAESRSDFVFQNKRWVYDVTFMSIERKVFV